MLLSVCAVMRECSQHLIKKNTAKADIQKLALRGGLKSEYYSASYCVLLGRNSRDFIKN